MFLPAGRPPLSRPFRTAGRFARTKRLLSLRLGVPSTSFSSGLSASCPLDNYGISNFAYHPSSPHYMRQYGRQFSSLVLDHKKEQLNPNNGGNGGQAGGDRTHALGGNDLFDILPIRHSRKLPPPVCPPSKLRNEVESIFDAPVGSLIQYSSPKDSTDLRTIAEEIERAYYAADTTIQHAEYILRGLNAHISQQSFVNRSLERGSMLLGSELERNGNSNDIEPNAEEVPEMKKEDCLNAMLDLIDRMETEGNAYMEMRRRIRSQLAVADGPFSNESSNSADSIGNGYADSDFSESDSDDNGSDYQKWTEQMQKKVRALAKNKVGSSKTTNVMAASATNQGEIDDVDDEESGASSEEYQFGAPPGVTTHMYDLLLDAIACLLHDSGDNFKWSDSLNEAPPTFAKSILEKVLHRHHLDGGDAYGFRSHTYGFNRIAAGVGTGAGTGAGSLAQITKGTVDVRTCPTLVTFNAVMRIAALFDHVRYAQHLARGEKTNVAMNEERLRDVTIDAAFSTYTRMIHCSSLLCSMNPNASTSRLTLKKLKKQASDLSKAPTPRNSATYAYLLQVVTNCFPPSMSRGNIAFGIYHKATQIERVLDKNVLKAMRGVGGWTDDDGRLPGITDDNSAPPISNGPLFDKWISKNLGQGVAAALATGRKLRYDHNYKTRRHSPWDGMY